MIDKEEIVKIINDKAEGKDVFVVDVSVSSNNSIKILIDSKKGVTINDCADFSKLVEGSLDREKEDFDLQVSSPGINKPFKVMEQYEKNIGKLVSVITKDGLKKEGELITVLKDNIEIAEEKKIKVNGERRKEIITHTIDFDFIKSTQIVL